MKKIRLGEVLDVKRGTSLAGENYATEGEFIRLTLGNFNYPGGGFKPNTSKDNIYYIGQVKPEFIMSKGDIITPLTEQVSGLLGETAIIPESNKYIQSGDVGKVIPNEEVLDKDFAPYLISSPTVKHQLDAASQQTKIRHTSPVKIKDCIAWIPELNEQKKIGNLLNIINKKITNNKDAIFALESLAKTIYDYWFLQFEFPNEEGKPYKSSDGKMVWNDELKREIPEGWEVKDLHRHIRVIRGVSYKPNEVKTSYENGFIPLLKSNNLQNDKLLLDDVIYVPKENVSNNQFLCNNSLLVTMSSGSTEHVGKIALIPYDTQYTFGAFCSKIEIEKEYRCFVSLFFLNTLFKTKIRKIISGTSIKNIKNEHLICNDIPFPPKNIVTRFEKTINPCFDKIAELMQENQQLTELRDFLLPMLMNGQVTFKDESAV